MSLAEREASYNKRKSAGFWPVVSEGDSWFSYELFDNIIDLIGEKEWFAHKRLEASGDTVENMVGTDAKVDALETVVEAEEPLFVLFSGGGNDIQNAAEHTQLFQQGDTPEECLVEANVRPLFDGLRDGYDRLIRRIGPLAPIVGHGYDYFTPSEEPVRILQWIKISGPWFYPRMMEAGVEKPELQKDIANDLIDRFNQILEELQQAHPESFHYVDLRGTLAESEWENEIHPTREGFERVTDKILEEIVGPVKKLVDARA